MPATLFGTKSSNCCGYCSLHCCYITVRQMRHKDCLKKQCYHLQKNEEHEFWRQQMICKGKRIARQERLLSYLERNHVKAVGE